MDVVEALARQAFVDRLGHTFQKPLVFLHALKPFPLDTRVGVMRQLLRDVVSFENETTSLSNCLITPTFHFASRILV